MLLFSVIPDAIRDLIKKREDSCFHRKDTGGLLLSHFIKNNR